MKDSPIPPPIKFRPTDDLFSSPPPDGARRGFWLLIACGVTLLLVVCSVYLYSTRRSSPQQHLNIEAPSDPYSANLRFSGAVMSQSTSLSGGVSTFLDGSVQNAGPDTIRGITVQVAFRNDAGLSPQLETLPLSLIRTREPYVDTEPVSSAPLKPGSTAEFRLIFEGVSPNWNQQLPEIRVVAVTR